MGIPVGRGGMQVDLGNSLRTVADPGISRDALDRLDAQISVSHDRICEGRDTNEFGYAALNLPESTETRKIEEAVTEMPDAGMVLTIGIGGSALGAVMLTEALGSGDSHIAIDNVDPVYVKQTLGELDFEETVIHVVSKSGSTIETIANFHVVMSAFESAGVDWTERTVVTTGDTGPLRSIANEYSLPVLDAPDNVPGRYAALSPVGLVPLEVLGHDVDAVLSGAAQSAQELSGSLYSTPAYAYAAVMAGLARRGVVANAMMPYAESLESFSEWFSQLWAESLGKDGFGQIPLRVLGVTDQHSQLQLYREGPRNTVVTFLRSASTAGVEVPAVEDPSMSFLDGVSLGEILHAEFEATEASLAAASRPSVRIEVDETEAGNLGKLVYGMEAACIMVGELQCVDPFDQPGVEWGKEATKALLGGGRSERLVELEGKVSLVVSE